MEQVTRVSMLLLCALLAAGCARTRVIEKRVEVPVEIMTPVAIPDTSFRQALRTLMVPIVTRPLSLDTLRAGASDSEILRAASIDLQYQRLMLLTIRKLLQNIDAD